MKSVSILGATGSVGQSTLDLIRRDPSGFTVIALTANSDVAGLAKAAIAVSARHAVIGDSARYDDLKAALVALAFRLPLGQMP